MSDIMHIGISALMAYQTALNVSSQNIANADTPFYSRRQVDFVESPFNSGVNVADVRRIYDDTANLYVQTSNSTNAMWNTYMQQLSQFEPLLDNNNISIRKFMTDALGALRQIETNFSPSNRSLYMNQLSSLSQQFQSVNAQILQGISNVNSTLQTETQEINNLLGGLANVNSQITAAGGNVQPDLLDQREALVQQLSTYIDFSRSLDQNGNLNISLSNGLSLVNGSEAVTFTTINDPSNQSNVLVAVQSGSNTIDVTHLIQGGEIAGWISYRQNALETTLVGLGRLALVFAQALNAQNKLGIDANTNLGGNIFNDVNTSSAINNRVIANSNNTGSSTMTVTIDSVPFGDFSQLVASDYKLAIGSGNTYILTRISDNTAVSSGTITGTFPQTIAADGFTLSINSGTFTNGDLYTISPTNGAAGNINLAITDPSELALGWPVMAGVGAQSPGSNGTISVDNIVDTTNSAFSIPKQLNPPITVKFTVSGGVTTYSLYNANTNVLMEGPINYTDGAAIFPTPGGYDPGYRVSISGNNIQDGDTFNIQYNANASSDSRNAVAMAGLYTAGTMLGADNQPVDFRSGYGAVASYISSETSNAIARYNTSSQVLTNAQQMQSEISGVALNEETLNLAAFQTAFQASAQVLQTAKSVFAIIVSIAGG